MNEISFRQASLDDIDTIKNWYGRIEGPRYFSHYIPSSMLDNRNENKAFLQWYIILNESNEIGCIWLEQKDQKRNELDLGVFLNDGALMGKGIGKVVIREFIKRRYDLMNDYQTCLNVRTDNQRAIGCYRRIGFEITDKRQKKSGESIIEYYRMRFVKKRIPRL